MARAMPTFAKSPPALVERFESLAALVPGATKKQMFGYPSFVLGGNMFMALFGDGMVLRLDEADQAALLAIKGARPFEPMPGRAMKGYVVAPPALVSTAKIEAWVAKSYALAQTLPAKAAKPAKSTVAKPPARRQRS